MFQTIESNETTSKISVLVYVTLASVAWNADVKSTTINDCFGVRLVWGN